MIHKNNNNPRDPNNNNNLERFVAAKKYKNVITLEYFNDAYLIVTVTIM